MLTHNINQRFTDQLFALARSAVREDAMKISHIRTVYNRGLHWCARLLGSADTIAQRSSTVSSYRHGHQHGDRDLRRPQARALGEAAF